MSPKPLILCLAASALILNTAASTRKAVTIDAMLSYHAGYGPRPIWTPDGKRFAHEEHGTVYLYDIAARQDKSWFEAQTLEKIATTPVSSKEFGWQNRRVAENSYQWFPNGQDLLAAVHGDLFIVHASGAHEQITATAIDEADPKLSPDGKQILYRHDSDLFVLDIATKAVRRLTTNGTPELLNGQLDWVYPEELDLSTASWWSPDSKSIAYLQFDVHAEFMYPQTDLLGERAVSEPERYPQAGTPNARVRLGVVPASGGETKWMKVGNSPDILVARVAWLPDSSAVAVETMPRVQNELELLFCDPETGTAKTIIHETSKDWINIADNLLFLKSRPQFLWTSERSGFRHLYLYENGGRLVRQITTGNWQVDSLAAVDERKQRVYYTSTETSPLEAQLYSVDWDGGARTRLSREGFTHAVSANTEGSYFVDTRSSLTHAPEADLLDQDGKTVAVLKAADSKAAEYALQPVQVLTLPAEDGTTLYAKLIKPANFQPNVKYPAIVEVYGGPQAQSIRNAWSGLDMAQIFAANGYVVWQLDNRGSFGRGHAFEAGLYHDLGRQEVADQKAGVEHLIKMGFVDPKRVGITGWSYGGYMTIHSLLLAPDVFKVGIAGAPVTDWHNYDTIYTERYMGLPQQNQHGYETSSNVKNAKNLQGKLLILHNFEDDNVLFQNTMQMANALEEADKPFTMQIFPQKTHGVSGALRKPLYEAMLDFFNRNLK